MGRMKMVVTIITTMKNLKSKRCVRNYTKMQPSVRKSMVSTMVMQTTLTMRIKQQMRKLFVIISVPSSLELTVKKEILLLEDPIFTKVVPKQLEDKSFSLHFSLLELLVLLFTQLCSTLNLLRERRQICLHKEERWHKYYVDTIGLCTDKNVTS